MAVTDAQRKASKKWEEEKVDRMTIRMKKGKKEQIESCAKKCGVSANTFVNQAIDRAIAATSSDTMPCD